jgi:hypothetical protein
MGRKAPRNVYKLDFSDTPYGKADEDGDPLEVSMTGLSMGEALDSAELEAMFRDGATEDQVKAVRGIVDQLAKHLVSWNLEDPDNGDPVSPGPSSLYAQDPLFLFDIVKAYRTAVLDVPGKSGTTSPAGARSEVELSLPMEPLSSSPPPSTEPNLSSAASSDSAATPSAPS